VNISGTGEALLTKHLAGLIKEFGDKDIRIEIVTNGDKLKPKLIKDLYAAGLTQLVVSMYDGPEQIEYFNNLFEECEVSSDLYTLRDRWYDKSEDYGLIYTNRAGSMGDKLSAPEHRPCYYPHYALYIDWNGDILLCCQDMYNRTVVFGNANDRPLFDIWKDQKLTEFRKKLKAGYRSESPCNNCNANGLVFGKSHAEAW
jgi:radical SAM protein with 4Fe4S-binding SPASM domain